MTRRPLLFALLAVGAATGCAPKPPARWTEGGAALLVQGARWERDGKDPIEILPDGQVVEDGDVLFIVDRVGRVADEDAEPVAVLLPDGHVAGTDRQSLGFVGVTNAALPGADTAWLTIAPDGRVVRFDYEGDPVDEGHWTGCKGPQQRTCTLVSHMILLRDFYRHPPPGVMVGVGIGVGF